MKKFFLFCGIGCGAVIALVGAIFIFMYFYEAVYARIGEADQSLLFWYLPILFLGLMGMGGGITLSISSFLALKSE